MPPILRQAYGVSSSRICSKPAFVSCWKTRGSAGVGIGGRGDGVGDAVGACVGVGETDGVAVSAGEAVRLGVGVGDGVAVGTPGVSVAGVGGLVAMSKRSSRFAVKTSPAEPLMVTYTRAQTASAGGVSSPVLIH